MNWLWLAAAAVTGIGAFLVGWPSWGGYQSRQARDLNAERYLAWRGRAPRGAERSTAAGMTGDERRRLLVAGALALVAAFCVVGFFTYA
jgi:hypothetical protein